MCYICSFMCTLYASYTFRYILSLEIVGPFSECCSPRGTEIESGTITRRAVCDRGVDSLFPRSGTRSRRPCSPTLGNTRLATCPAVCDSFDVVQANLRDNPPCSCSSVWQLATRSRDTADTVLSLSLSLSLSLGGGESAVTLLAGFARRAKEPHRRTRRDFPLST